MSAALTSLSPHPETETVFIGRPPVAPRTPLRELARVQVTVDVRTLEDDPVSAGSVGTIVGIWKDGDLFDVEFEGALGPATIARGLLEPA